MVILPTLKIKSYSISVVDHMTNRHLDFSSLQNDFQWTYSWMSRVLSSYIDHQYFRYPYTRIDHETPNLLDDIRSSNFWVIFFIRYLAQSPPKPPFDIG